MVFLHPDDKRQQQIPDNFRDARVTSGPSESLTDTMQKRFEANVMAKQFNSETMSENIVVQDLNDSAIKKGAITPEESINYYNPPTNIIEKRGFKGAVDKFSEDPVGTIKEFSSSTNMFSNLLTQVGAAFGGVPLVDTGIPIAQQEHVKQFHKNMKKAHKQTGDPIFKKASTREGLKQIVKDRSQKAELKGRDAWNRAYSLSSQFTSFGSDFASIILADPINTATLPIGAGAGQNFTTRLLTNFVVEGIIEGAQQPDIQEFRDKLNLKSGLKEGVRNTLLAATAGATLGAAIEGAAKGVSKTFNKFKANRIAKGLQDEFDLEEGRAKRLANGLIEGEIEKSELRDQVVKNGKGENIDLMRAAQELHEVNQKARRMNPYFNQKTMNREIGRQEYQKNLDKVQQDIIEGRPLRETKTGEFDAVAQKIQSYGESIPGERIDPENIAKDFKVETERGLTTPVFFEKSDGTLKLIEGSKDRLKQAKAEGNEIRGNVLRESQGITEDEAKLWTVARRFESGEASKQDIAQLFDDLEPEDIGIPERSFLGDYFQGVTKLDDEVYFNAKNDDVPLNHMAVIGRTFDDPQKQAKAFDLLQGTESTQEAGQIMAEAKQRGIEEVDPEEIFERRKEVFGEFERLARNNELNVKDETGKEIDFTDERITQFRRMAEQSGRFQEILAEASMEAKQQNSTRAGADKLAQLIERNNIGNRTGGDAPSAQRDAARAEGEIREGKAQRATNRREELDGLQKIIRNREHEIFELKERIKQDEDLGDKEILHPDDTELENPRKIKAKDYIEELEENQRAIDRLEECFL